MVGGHVLGCRRTSQQQQQQTQRKEHQTKNKSLENKEEKLLASANEKVSKIKITSLNAYNHISIKKHKVKHLEALLREEKINILCLQETWLRDDILKAEVHIDEFRT